MKVAFILGTRPEIIKLSPLIREAQERNIQFSILHTGQHYSENLNNVFFDDLNLPKPDYNFSVGSGKHGMQTGEMIIETEAAILEEKPDVALVQGDTNSVLAGAVACSKLDCKLGHVEAGLRSFNREMPEELNRTLTDHAADFLFAPTETSKENLQREGISESRITVTGNTVVDAVKQHQNLARDKSEIISRLGLVSKNFFLLTLHRAGNVDNKGVFERILSGVSEAADKFDSTVIYPVHPRARNRIEEYNITVPSNVRTIDPVDYLDFILLEKESDLILTDSGGVQEEACSLETPCVTLREDTERPETLEVGSNILAGTDRETIIDAVEQMYLIPIDWENPYGDGSAAEAILDVIS